MKQIPGIIKSSVAVGILLGSALAVLPFDSQATPTIYLGWSNTPTSSITDLANGAAPGGASFSGAVANGFSVSGFSGTGDFNPYALQTQTLTTDYTGSTPASISLWVTLTDLPLADFTSTIYSGLTQNAVNQNWDITETTYYDASGTKYGHGAGTELASYTFTQNGSTVSKNYYNYGLTTPTVPFSVTTEFTITANANGSANSTISMHAVPEPSNLGMMGLGLMVIGLMGLKIRQKKFSGKSSLEA